jgi:hypothetical protein
MKTKKQLPLHSVTIRYGLRDYQSLQDIAECIDALVVSQLLGSMQCLRAQARDSIFVTKQPRVKLFPQ